MLHVAFIRNLNQGQRGHPSSGDVVAAFIAAGALDPIPFQSNGTIVFAADDPNVVVKAATAMLAADDGVERDGFWMPLTEVAAIVDAHSAAPDVARREITLHGGGTIDVADPAVVREAAHRRCEVADAGKGWIVSINERDRESNATPLAQRLTGSPATSRGLPTLVRLVDRFAR